MKHTYYLLLITAALAFIVGCNEHHNIAPVASKEASGYYEIEEEVSANGLADNSSYGWNLETPNENSGFVISATDNCDAEVSEDSMNNGSTDNSPVKSKQDVAEQTPAYQRKLIRKADLKFETDSLSWTKATLVNSVKKLGGYVSSENQANGKYINTAYLNLRVPSENFDALISVCDAQGVNNFERRVISASDVTEEFLDVSARIKTNKELENRYYDLLKMAKNVEEVIKVERELGKLRNIIESAEGRLKYLSDRVSLSTVKVEFYQTLELAPEVNDRPNRLIRAFSSGWGGLISFLLVLVNIWPMLIIGGFLTFYITKKLRTPAKPKA